MVKLERRLYLDFTLFDVLVDELKVQAAKAGRLMHEDKWDAYCICKGGAMNLKVRGGGCTVYALQCEGGGSIGLHSIQSKR